MIIIYSYLDSFSFYIHIIDIYNFNINTPFGIYEDKIGIYAYKNLSQMSAYYRSDLYISLEDYDPYDISMDYKLVE